MERSRKLIVLSGLPGSGKSYYCMLLRGYDSNVIVVSRDKIRKMWERTFGIVDDVQLTRDMIHNASLAMATGRTVAIDAMNLHPHDRLRWETLAWSFGYELEWMELKTPVEVCIERDSKREEPVGRKRIMQYAAEAQIA